MLRLAQEGGLFFYTQLRTKLLCADWTLVCERVPFATMASRFAEIDENGIQDLIVSSENINTRKSSNYWPKTYFNRDQQQGLVGFEESSRRILPSMS